MGAHRDRALDHGDVLAGQVVDRLVPRLLGLVAGRGHQGLVVVDRQDVEDDLGRRRVLGAQEGFRVAGAVLELEPDEGGLRLGRDRLGDLGGSRLGQGQEPGHRGAELRELAARDPPSLELRPQEVVAFVHGHLPCRNGAQQGPCLPENGRKRPWRTQPSRAARAAARKSFDRAHTVLPWGYRCARQTRHGTPHPHPRRRHGRNHHGEPAPQALPPRGGDHHRRRLQRPPPLSAGPALRALRPLRPGGDCPPAQGPAPRRHHLRRAADRRRAHRPERGRPRGRRDPRLRRAHRGDRQPPHARRDRGPPRPRVAREGLRLLLARRRHGPALRARGLRGRKARCRRD